MLSLSEKFFDERELQVIYADNQENDAVTKAKLWFNSVDEVISLLPIYRHDNLGNEDVSHASSEGKERESGVWFFRGQNDKSYAFNSSLFRLTIAAAQRGDISLVTPKHHEKQMLKAELKLLEKAKKHGIGRGLTALETLTLLQHHGAPTRLIDVTSDWKVALFFACEGNDNRDGRIFLVKIDAKRWKDFPQAKIIDTGFQKPVWEDYQRAFPAGSGLYPDYSWLSGVWPVLLPFSDPRMISQRGFFLVGGIPSPKGKSFLNTSECNECKNKLCDCGKKEYRTKSKGLKTSEHREVTSLTIRFGAEKKTITQLDKVKFNNWTAIGYSIVVPADIKPHLRQILRDKGIHPDSIYPPLRETVRLFQDVVEDSFKDS